MRTCALVAKDSSIDHYCHPYFDSPSVFARILDKDIGGFFAIEPVEHANSKQHYLPNTAIVTTKWLNEAGVVNIVDYMPRPRPSLTSRIRPLYPFIMRRVEAVRGRMRVKIAVFPAFNYAQDRHDTEISKDGLRVHFTSKDLKLEILAITHEDKEGQSPPPKIKFQLDGKSHPRMLGAGVIAEVDLQEGQVFTLILREPIKEAEEVDDIRDGHVDYLLSDTTDFWLTWLRQSKYAGRWREFIFRSAITLKLLTFEPTGAIVAAATFSLPESLGAGRNWDYRYTWLRDASFTVYALLRLGFTKEADAYMSFMQQRICETKSKDIQIMYTIHGGRDIEEIELPHLSGYKDSKPVRIGNGAADHLQLDVYGEFMDAVYLHQKFSKPISYDFWLEIRRLVDRVCELWDQPDMSIWEVRSRKQNYVYSKVMMWVAINRGLRIADKRSLPCPRRAKWLEVQDTIYEDIMTKGYNFDKKHFAQSYESLDVLDSSCLIMPLCFFISPADERFRNTLKAILRSPEKGGLTANSLLFRYDTAKAEDGIDGSEEGAFSMCTLWAIEAMSRVGTYGDTELLKSSIRMFDEFLTYGNHVSLYAEEISSSGEFLGNMPQAFTHVSAISTAFNLDRVLGKGQRDV